MAIELEVVSNSKQAQQDLAQLRNSVDNIAVTTAKASSSFKTMALGLAASVASISSIKAFMGYSDILTNMESRLRLVTDSQLEFNKALKDVRNIAMTSRANLGATATLYNKVAMSTKAFGASQKDIARFTELTGKAITTSGASAQEAASAMLQLGQGLASGKLAGEELKAVLENAPALAYQIAQGLGVGIGKLREMGEEGTLTGKKVFGAILKQQDEINKNFSKVGITYAQAFTNLGTSLLVLFGAVKKSAFSSTSSLAEGINNISKGIFNIATRFSLVMLNARSSAIKFMNVVIMLFVDLWDIFSETGERVKLFVTDLWIAWKPTISAMTASALAWAVVTIEAFKSVYQSFTSYFKSTSFGQTLIGIFDKSVIALKKVAKTVSGIFKNLFPTIDVSKFFPHLNEIGEFVKAWAIKVERWFFWLYDQVIGHSWIPDLVNGVIFWTKKLIGTPLKSVFEFATKSSGMFAKIRIGGAFAAGLTILGKYKTALGLVLAGITAIAAVKLFTDWKPKLPSVSDTTSSVKDSANDLLSKSLKKSADAAEATRSTISKKTNNILESVKANTARTYIELKDKFDNSNVGHTIKQVLGLPDNKGGMIFGTDPIDSRPQAKVGRGPQRSQEERPIGHDIIQALPRDWQAPFLTALTGVFALAIVAMTKTPIVRSALLGLLTTVYGLVMARTMYKSDISKFTGNVTNGLMVGTKKVLDGLFSGNAAKDPWGMLTIIAKLSLLFKSGRDYFGNLAVQGAIAPTKAVLGVGTAIEAKATKGFYKRAELKADIANKLAFRNAEAVKEQIRLLSTMSNSSGNKISKFDASEAIRNKDYSAFGTAQTKSQLTTAISTNKNHLESIELAKALQKNADSLKGRLDGLQTRLSDAKTAFVGGVKNISAGAGGIVGGVAGYQLGVEIAQGMTNLTSWQKVGVAMGVSFLGQALGATLGLALGSTITMAMTGAWWAIAAGLTAVMSIPVLGLPIVIAGALYIGYQLWQGLGKEWAASFFFKDDKAKIENLNKKIEDNTAKINANRAALEISRNTPEFDRNYQAEKVLEELLKKLTNEQINMRGQIDQVRKEAGVVGSAVLPTATKALPKDVAISGDIKEQTINIANLVTDKRIGDIDKSWALRNTELIKAYKDGHIGFMDFAWKKFDAWDEKVTAKFLEGLKNWSAHEQAPVKRASGGGVFGAGTATSDSIPALLSNGEFVVNAKDAAKHWELLTKINNGQDISKLARGSVIQRFATGGSPSPGIAKVEVVNSNWLENIADKVFAGGGDILKRVKDTPFAKQLMGQATVVANKNIPNAVGATRDVKAADAIVQALNKSKDMFSAQELLSNELVKQNVKGANAKSLSNLKTNEALDIASVLDSIKYHQTKANDSKLPGFARKINQEAANDFKAQLQDMLAGLQDSGKLSNTTDTEVPDAKKSKEDILTVLDQFDIINRQFPELSLSIEEFWKMTDQTRQAIFSKANALNKTATAIETTKIGTDGNTPATVFKKRQAYEESRKDESKNVQGILKPLRTPFKAFAATFAKVGVQFNESVFNQMTDTQREMAEGALRAVESATKITESAANSGVTAEARKEAAIIIETNLSNLQNALNDINFKWDRSGFGASQREFKSLGIDLDREAFNLMTSAQKATLQSLGNALRQAEFALNSPELDPAARAAAQEAYNSTQRSIAFHLAKIKDVEAKAAGVAFANNLTNGFKDGFGNYLKSKATWKETATALLDTISNNIIDTFMNGLMEGIMGDGESGIMKMLKDVGSSLFGTAAGGSEAATEALSNTGIGEAVALAMSKYFPTSMQQVNAPDGTTSLDLFSGQMGIDSYGLDAFSEQSQMLKEQDDVFKIGNNGFESSWDSGIEGFDSVFTKGVSTFGALLGSFGGTSGDAAKGWIDTAVSVASLFLAEGGSIAGPGTGTSDSIPAMLSNGEFVVNAKSAQQNRSLLEAINSGRIPRFANGGSVGTILNAPVDSVQSKSKPAEIVQTFNLNITGDVSRQTRSEIQRMIPQIAVGVGMHNYEQGTRR